MKYEAARQFNLPNVYMTSLNTPVAIPWGRLNHNMGG